MTCSTSSSEASAWESSESCRRGLVAGQLLELARTRPNRPGNPALGHRRLDHTRAKVIAAALGQHVSIDGAGFVAHTTGQVAQSKAQSCAIKVLDHGAVDDRFELTYTRILSSRKPEILPRSMAWADHF